MEVKSAYLPKFKKLSSEVLEAFKLRGNLIVVEKIVIEKKTKSGIITSPVNQNHFASIHANTLDFHVVVAIGSGYENEDGKDDPTLLECQVGDIVCLPSGAVNYLGYFGTTVGTDGVDKIGISRSSDIFMNWKGQEKFEAFFKEFDA